MAVQGYQNNLCFTGNTASRKLLVVPMEPDMLTDYYRTNYKMRRPVVFSYWGEKGGTVKSGIRREEMAW